MEEREGMLAMRPGSDCLGDLGETEDREKQTGKHGPSPRGCKRFPGEGWKRDWVQCKIAVYYLGLNCPNVDAVEDSFLINCNFPYVQSMMTAFAKGCSAT